MSTEDTKEKVTPAAVTDEPANSAESKEDGPHEYRDTAMGLGRAVTRATLTPVVGLGLMGVAAHDAIASGTIGTIHKAENLIGFTKRDAVDLKGCTLGSISEHDGSDTPGADEPTPIEVFCIEDAEWKNLRKQYVDKGIPFILRKKDGSKISSVMPPQEADPDAPSGNISVLADSIKVKLENIDDIIKKILPHTYRAYWPLWFQGNYKSGLAHVDLGPGTTNFYCLQRGKKDVVIADYEVTRQLSLKTGIDNLYMPDSSGNHDYLDRLPKYYRVTLEENSILVFNNSGCLHHFTNIIEEGVTPIALSVRCKHSLGSDPRGWLHLATDLKVWWNMTDHVMALSGKTADSRPQDKA
mmetsp:Transcript_14960/g.24745  ORF Transcript_14960/g.24745 Transcript_14960/m.24745 type:complete len:354 (-) Transcript_14960:224-1285(-)|eukprot:CAMPEP_0119007834 /NCGR_PEP_ID=MMETSP1176-20130426/3288_1 /TAXON_ID=265551 /ORGANISM="Synedropsis recta cf, Strain CCMP1620" /LENGTH=353 /DNA_ID=CAMNT_0006960067 /DNA_START=124 /DNA_END=1185 /DNA_ORIENTATION=-